MHKCTSFITDGTRKCRRIRIFTSNVSVRMSMQLQLQCGFFSVHNIYIIYTRCIIRKRVSRYIIQGTRRGCKRKHIRRTWSLQYIKITHRVNIIIIIYNIIMMKMQTIIILLYDDDERPMDGRRIAYACMYLYRYRTTTTFPREFIYYYHIIRAVYLHNSRYFIIPGTRYNHTYIIHNNVRVTYYSRRFVERFSKRPSYCSSSAYPICNMYI